MSHGDLIVTPPLVLVTGTAKRMSSENQRPHNGGVYGLCLSLTGSRNMAEDCTLGDVSGGVASFARISSS
jgi:hypothetical protein